MKNLVLFYVFFTCNRVALCGAVQVRGQRGGGGVVPLQVRGICLQRNIEDQKISMKLSFYFA